MFALPVSDRGPRRRAWVAGVLSFLTAGAVGLAVERTQLVSAPLTAWRSHGAPTAAPDDDRAGCPRQRQRPPVAVLLVQVRSADLDLAAYLDADRPDGFQARVLSLGELRHAPDVDGDPATWRAVGVHMHWTDATALAWRLRQLPAIADARVHYVHQRRPHH